MHLCREVIIMAYKIASLLVSVLAFSTYYFPKDKPTDQRKVNLPLQKQSEREVEEWREKFIAQQEAIVEKLKEEFKTVQNLTRPPPSEENVFPSTITTLSGSLPLGTVFIILLIHTSGADLVAAVYAVTLHLFSINLFINLVFGTATLYYINKLKREKEELVNTNCELQRKLQAREQDYRNETATLVEVKNKLKTWIDHIRIIAEDVEAERNEN